MENQPISSYFQIRGGFKSMNSYRVSICGRILSCLPWAYLTVTQGAELKLYIQFKVEIVFLFLICNNIKEEHYQFKMLNYPRSKGERKQNKKTLQFVSVLSAFVDHHSKDIINSQFVCSWVKAVKCEKCQIRT